MTARTWDAVIVGGGHNGLVAAFYLARGGLKTLVLERRPFVGGACNTEEFAPGYRASTGAYVLSMLRPAIWQDFKLVERGIVVDPAGPTLNLYPDGASYLLGDDMAENVEATKHFSVADSRALPAFEDELGEVVKAVLPIFDMTAPDPRVRGLDDLRTLLTIGRLAARHRKHANELLELFTSSAGQVLAERFESEHVRAALGWHAINDSTAGPSTPGSAFVLLHDHASDTGDAGVRQWGFVRGGMGVLTQKMADAAREAGATVRVDAEVESVLTKGDRAVGVRLVDGEEILATRVLSNADPKRTFLGLCRDAALPDDFVRAIEAYRCMGTSIKINLGLSALPEAKGQPKGLQPYHSGIVEVNPFIAEMDLQQAQAAYGVAARDSHVELCFPTVHDPSLAPEGKHIATIDVNSQPFHLREGTWDEIKETRADEVIAQLEQHFPGLSGLVEHRQVLSPLDMERVMGLTGGHALHGDMAPHQLLFMRPARGWAKYRTPLRGLYLCGAGTHPGGGVTGANGRNAAREVLKDAKKRR
ncbi:NAD(P)/FAD-dependent oxidoreductase [Nocardioides bigeumensis]|uniref:Pyridine nucleotide-disulfide oxidoreductase domain-containing protein 2 n=1 Tax=Nocardioides bigeumensis TaxID=433657 RepID=A0ABN2YZN6_9ACTN